MRPALLVPPLLLSGCLAASEDVGDVTRAAGPDAAVAGTCWAEGATPDVVETETREVVEVPAMVIPDGTVLREAKVRTETTSRVVTPGEPVRFEAPCALLRGDADFVMQVQRALAARDLYEGPVHGLYDAATRAAVEAFQREAGLASGTLSSASARTLGLVAVERPG